MRQAKAFRCEERGATAIEYALIAGFASVLILVGAELLGHNVNALFQIAADAFGA